MRGGTLLQPPDGVHRNIDISRVVMAPVFLQHKLCTVLLMHILYRNVSQLAKVLSYPHAASTLPPDVMLLFLPRVPVASGSSPHLVYISLTFHEFVQ
jgi:hypothetical protein